MNEIRKLKLLISKNAYVTIESYKQNMPSCSHYVYNPLIMSVK